MQNLSSVNQRIKDVLNKDQMLKSDNLLGVLKSDLFDLIQNYFVISDEEMLLSVEKTESGFELNLKVFCDRVKTLNYLH